MTDTHCHINFPEHFSDPSTTIARAEQVGVTRIIAVGCDTETSRRAIELADIHKQVFACVGWHPTYTSKYDPSELKAIEEFAHHPKCVAIGEIGLDYHWDYSTPEQQRVSLEDHFALAQSVGKAVVFHCREAYADLLSWLENKQRSTPMILHCFAGDSGDAKRAMDLDCYFGIDGPITYKNAMALRDIVKALPSDRLLLETDAPYLTPHPFRGKPNEPAMIPLINAALAQAIGNNPENLGHRTDENACMAFTFAN